MSSAYTNVSDDRILDCDDKMDCDRRKSSRKRFELNTTAVWIFFGLLFFILLVVILILLAHNSIAISSWNSHQQSPDEKDNLSSMIMELEDKFNNLTQKKIEEIKGGCSSLGWIEVNRECYYISPKGVSKSWTNSKKDCESQGGRLVIIKNWSKLNLLGMFYDRAWIGLSDRKTEGRWVWEDGAGFAESNLWIEGEPNDADGREDCAHLTVIAGKTGFNDMPCSSSFPYICETLE